MEKFDISIKWEHWLIQINNFSSMTKLNLSRPLWRLVKNVRWLNNPKTWDLVLKRWKVFRFVICSIELLLTLLDHYLKLFKVINMCINHWPLFQMMWSSTYQKTWCTNHYKISWKMKWSIDMGCLNTFWQIMGLNWWRNLLKHAKIRALPTSSLHLLGFNAMTWLNA